MNSDPIANDLFARLVAAATAYPSHLFPPLTDEVKARYPELIAAASADMGRTLAPLLAEAAVAVLRASDSAKVSARGREGLEGLDRWVGQLQHRPGLARQGEPAEPRQQRVELSESPPTADPAPANAAEWLLRVADLGADARHALRSGKVDLAIEHVITAATALARWHATLTLLSVGHGPNPHFPRYR